MSKNLTDVFAPTDCPTPEQTVRMERVLRGFENRETLAKAMAKRPQIDAARRETNRLKRLARLRQRFPWLGSEDT